MLSLGNVFDADEFREFVERARRFLGLAADADLRFVGEPKIDGLSINLTYEHGAFVRGATRGDGLEGEDVTANLQTLKTLPRKLHGDAPALIEIRGEVFMTKADFLALNAAQEAAGQRLFANPRNAAAGSLRQLDAAHHGEPPALAVRLRARARPARRSPKTHWDYLERLKAWGFTVNPLSRRCTTRSRRRRSRTRWRRGRAALDYDIDGVVYKIDDLGLQRSARLSSAARRAGRSPGSFPPSRRRPCWKTSTIQVGRTGALTPVARLQPVNVGGVLVHATPRCTTRTRSRARTCASATP